MKTSSRKWAWTHLLDEAREAGVRRELPIVVWKERSWSGLLWLAVLGASAFLLGTAWR